MKSSLSYPRLILFTTYDIFKVNSSVSVTIRSFLGDWPLDSIYQVVCSDLADTKVGKIDSQTYVLSHQDIFIASNFKIKEQVSSSNALLTSAKTSKHINFKSLVRKSLSAFYQLFPYKLSDEFSAFIHEAKPDLLYINIANLRSLLFVKKISKKYHLPTLLHIYDDWPATTYSESFILKPIRAIFLKTLYYFFNHSKVCLCISQDMCLEYKHRYKKDIYEPLMNSSQSIDKINNKNIENLSHGDFTITYMGSLYLDRYNTLLELARSIKKLNINNLSIKIYCPNIQWESVKSLFIKYPFITYGGFVAPEDMNDIIYSSDFLLFLESLKDDYLKFTRFSMSTKVPIYLSSRNPIIAIGNELQGSISYLKRNDSAYVATCTEEIPILLSQITSSSSCKHKIFNAYNLFLKNHLQSDQQFKFYNIVQKCLN